MHRRAMAGALVLGVWISGCEALLGIEEGKLGYCTDDSTGATNPLTDDGNSCTIAQCVGSSVVHVATDDGTLCARGENPGRCNAGSCKLDCEGNPESCKCTGDTECPVSNACVTWACTSKQCARSDKPDMTPVDTADPNDCKKTVCISGAPQVVNDENDTLADVLGDCKKPTCVNMMPSTEALDTDEPQDDECTDWSCSNGEKTNKDAAVGAVCATGVCSAAGQCVDCLTKFDWDQCGGPACPVKPCNGEACSGGLECKSGACADGVCCNEACGEVCKSCNVAGTEGVCSNIPYYQEDFYSGAGMTCELAIAGAVCDGDGKCLKTSGTACTMHSQCISNMCNSNTVKCLGATGEGCSANAECVSGMCSMGTCK